MLDIETAAEFWTWLNATAAVSAKQNHLLTLEALHDIQATSDESVTQFSVRAMSKRERLILGGGHMDGSTLFMLITRSLPDRLKSGKIDVVKKDAHLYASMSYLQRTENVAIMSDGTIQKRTGCAPPGFLEYDKLQQYMRKQCNFLFCAANQIEEESYQFGDSLCGGA